jgi:hypothetical protein
MPAAFAQNCYMRGLRHDHRIELRDCAVCGVCFSCPARCALKAQLCRPCGRAGRGSLGHRDATRNPCAWYRGRSYAVVDLDRRQTDTTIEEPARWRRPNWALSAIGDHRKIGQVHDGGRPEADQPFSPCAAIWPSPIVLMNTPCVSKRLLETSLPMMRSGAVEARDNEDRRHCCQFMQNCRQRTSEWHRAQAGRSCTRTPPPKMGSRYSLLHRRHRTSTCWGR